MLCELAHAFPPRVADLLERDRGLTRNFREESVTDLLMASMVGLEKFGVRVDFPDEPTTGGDMDWIYAAPLEVGGGRYMRIILQAKRAQYAKLKTGGYWYYQHLDHGDPKGAQAQTLISYAAGSPGAKATLPLYIFYHPASALAPGARGQPAIDGINLVFADHVAPIVLNGCKRKEKKISYWREKFLPLSDILCWPAVVIGPRDPMDPAVTRFVVGGGEGVIPSITGGFHPDLVARRFIERRVRVSGEAAAEPVTSPIEPAYDIPPDIRRAIDGEVTAEDRIQLKRPRVILSTQLTREDPDFARVESLINRPD